MDVLFLIYVFAVGCCVGSFLNVLIYRLPLKTDIVVENSHCMSCNHTLAWYDLVPVLSYVFLKGRCRYCKGNISIQYPIVELLNGIAYLLIIMYSDRWTDIVVRFMLVSALIVISVVDIKTGEIPFSMNVVVFIAGLVNLYANKESLPLHTLSFVCATAFFVPLYYIFKGRLIGGGDIKLILCSSILFSPLLTFMVYLFSCILASLGYIVERIVSKKNIRIIRFGPYLTISIMFMYLFGIELLEWYMHMIL